MAQPSRKSPAGQPVANTNGGRGIIAPWPMIDRYPTILGSNISIGYISSIFRLCLSGYRQQYVDLLDEMLISEPHGYAVLQHRFNTTAGGRVEVSACDLPKIDGHDHPEAEEAQFIAEDLASIIDAIPERQKAFNRLLWGLYYGVSAAEILYDYGRDGPGDWRVIGLNFIHSRRIAYPDQTSWVPRIWDQGGINPLHAVGSDPTTAMFGMPVTAFPGKFIIFESAIRGDYPTREGLGIQLAYWFGLKGMAARGAGEYIERFGKPWAFGTYSTAEPKLGSRAATNEDIQQGNAALGALGIGSLAAAMLPDSIKIDLAGPGVNAGSSGITHKEILAYIDSQIEEVVLTTSGITTPGPNGSRSSREVMKEGTRETFRYDARCLADTLRRDLLRPLMLLRHPGREHLCPQITIHVDEQPSPLDIIKVAKEAALAGLPLAADPIAKQLGFALVPPLDPKAPPRRLYPAKPIEPFDLPLSPPTEEEVEETEAAPPDGEDDIEPKDEDDDSEEGDEDAEGGEKGSPKPAAKKPKAVAKSRDVRATDRPHLPLRRRFHTHG